jgi:very-short-patch-repair endonuclease
MTNMALFRDTAFRESYNRKILDKYGTWDNWWNSIRSEFGTAIIDRLADANPQALAETLDQGRCESPMEEKFWSAAAGEIDGLTPQFQIGEYRVDFAIQPRKVVIEIDGHDFHKTPEQRTEDAQRQRRLEAIGWRVVRFTGKEVDRDAPGCVRELEAIIDAMEGVSA